MQHNYHIINKATQNQRIYAGSHSQGDNQPEFNNTKAVRYERLYYFASLDKTRIIGYNTYRSTISV